MCPSKDIYPLQGSNMSLSSFGKTQLEKEGKFFDENAKFKITSFGPIRYQNNFNFYEFLF